MFFFKISPLQSLYFNKNNDLCIENNINLHTQMTKADIVNEIYKATGYDKAEVLNIVEKLMVVIKDSLANGENVYLRGFGSFIIKTRAQKVARNISKGETVIVPEHNIPAFKPSDSFTEMIK